MSTTLDLRRRHATFRRRNIIAICTWFRNHDRRWRPCLVMVRDGEEQSEHTMPCIIPIDNAWIWSEEIGDPSLAARSAMQFAKALRIDDDPLAPIFIAGFIHDLLGDLLSIPPLQDEGEIVADVVFTDRNTGKTGEAVIRDV